MLVWFRFCRVVVVVARCCLLCVIGLLGCGVNILECVLLCVVVVSVCSVWCVLFGGVRCVLAPIGMI